MKEMTCIICPRGCRLTVSDNNEVTGNSCPRGAKYAIEELTHPMRTLTSSIRVMNKDDLLVSVKTNKPIPKEKMFDLMEFINTLGVNAPCHIGEVVVHNPLGLDCDILITKNIE